VTTPTRGRRGSRIGPSRGHDGLHGGGLVPKATSRSRRRRRKKEKSSGRGKKEKEKERLILPPLPFDHGTCTLPSHFQLRELSWEREFDGYYPRLKYSPFCPVNPFEISALFEALGGKTPSRPFHFHGSELLLDRRNRAIRPNPISPLLSTPTHPHSHWTGRWHIILHLASCIDQRVAVERRRQAT